MALYNEVLDPRVNEGIIRRFGLRQDAPSPQLAGELAPSFDVLDPPLEVRYLMRETLCWGWANPAAAAAKYSWVQLVNPGSSGLIVVVEEVRMWAAAANSWKIGKNATTGGSNASWETRDTRASLIPPVIVKSGTDAVTDIGGASFSGLLTVAPANQEAIVSDVAVLSPGTYLVVCGNVVNVAFNVSFKYRYRWLNPSEL